MKKILFITTILLSIATNLQANQCSCICMNGKPVEVCPQGVPSWGAACLGVFNCF